VCFANFEAMYLVAHGCQEQQLSAPFMTDALSRELCGMCLQHLINIGA
jgi:hypothetical protein